MKATLVIVFVIVLGAVLTAVGAYLLAMGFRLSDMETRAMKGELIPFEVDLQKPFLVNLGSNILETTIGQLEEGIDLRRYISYMEYEYPIQIRFKDGKLLVSAEIKNSDGVLVAKIKDNLWVVREDVMIARDRNYNPYALEVIDSDSVPVLQVVLNPRNQIYIGGFFYSPEGRMLVTPNGLIINPSSDRISEHIERIFKYPSDEYLGQMAIMEPEKNLITTVLGKPKSAWYVAIGLIFGVLGPIFFAVGTIYLGFRLKDKEKSK